MDTLTITIDLNDVNSVKEQFADVMAKVNTKKEELKMIVINFAKDKSSKHRAQWTQVVNNGLVDNVHSILSGCYTSLQDPSLVESNTIAENARLLGKIGSPAWRIFVLNVIESLYNEGAFYDTERKEYDSFEDTSGGCDEIVWYKACELLS